MCEHLPDCVEAGQVWRIWDLFEDLGKKKSGKKELEDWEKLFLCLLLNKNKPKDIAERLNYSKQSLNVKLSEKNGLYKCFHKLTGKKIEHWKDIIIYSMDKYYQGENKGQNKVLIITISLNTLSKEQISHLERSLREITGSNAVKHIGIDEGSMILIFQSNAEVCQKIETLFKENQLDVLLGVPVANVQVLVPPKLKPVINLNNWFQGLFDLDWLYPNQLILSPNIRYISEFEINLEKLSNSISRAKRLKLKDCELVLVVRVTKSEMEDVNIKVCLCLTKTGSTNKYLPFGIQFTVKDEQGETMQQQARESDVWLWLEFSVKPEEQFSISASLSETSVTENFMI